MWLVLSLLKRLKRNPPPQRFRKDRVISKQPEVIIDQIWIQLEELVLDAPPSLAVPVYERMVIATVERRMGAKVIDRMSYDLKESFPDMNVFSPRNLNI